MNTTSFMPEETTIIDLENFYSLCLEPLKSINNYGHELEQNILRICNGMSPNIITAAWGNYMNPLIHLTGTTKEPGYLGKMIDSWADSGASLTNMYKMNAFNADENEMHQVQNIENKIVEDYNTFVFNGMNQIVQSDVAVPQDITTNLYDKWFELGQSLVQEIQSHNSEAMKWIREGLGYYHSAHRLISQMPRLINQVFTLHSPIKPGEVAKTN